MRAKLHEFEANDIKFPVWKHEAKTKITKRSVPDRWTVLLIRVDPGGKRQAKPAKKRFGTVYPGSQREIEPGRQRRGNRGNRKTETELIGTE